MKNLKLHLPLLILILFQLAAGILIFVNRESFTKGIFIFLGVVSLVIGLLYLIRFFKERKLEVRTSYITIVIAVLSLLAGIFFAIFSFFLIEKLTEVAFIIFGVTLIVFGVYKAKNYNDTRKAGAPSPAMHLLSAIISVVLGVFFIIHPFERSVIWTILGVALIVMAVIDFAALAMNFRLKVEEKAKEDIVIEADEKPAVEESADSNE